MAKVVVDTTVLVSAYLKRVPGGVSFDLLRLAEEGKFQLFLSEPILDETARTLLRSGRTRQRYAYTDAGVIDYCQALARFAVIVRDVPELRVVRDPNDDMILACSIAAGADYLVSRDKDLLSIGEYGDVKIVTPEAFLGILRQL